MQDPNIYNDVNIWNDSDVWLDTDQRHIGTDVYLLSGQAQLDAERFCETLYWWDVQIWDDNLIWQEEECVTLKQTMIDVVLESGIYRRSSKYGSMLFNLLPTGDAWPPESEDTVLKKFLYGVAEGLQRAEDRINEVTEDIYPDQAGIFLTDWERVLQLPKCDIDGLTIQERLSSVLAMFNISPYTNKEFLEEVAAVFGFDVEITSGVALPGNRRNVFKIYATVQNPTEPIYFRAGISMAGDPLVKYEFGPVECLLNFFKPAHTYIEFEFSFPDGDPIGLQATLDCELTGGTYNV